MPLFIPINPPEQHEDNDTKTVATSLVHVEEEVRKLLQQYQVALQQWDEGRLDKACNSFAELSKRELIISKQGVHVENECDAYSREYGGISINRFRSLVFANYGRLLMANSGIKTAQEGFSDLNDRVAAIDGSKSLVLYDSLSKLQAALAFDSDDITYKMTIGQYSMLLGRIDIAISAFLDAIRAKAAADSRISDISLTTNGPLFRRWGPYQWQCAQAAVQAALIRGDIGTTVDIVNLAFEQNREASRALTRFVEDKIGASLYQSLPPVICLPRVLPTAESDLSVPSRTVVISSKNNHTSLYAVGEEILAYYNWAIQSDIELGSYMLAANVSFEIQTESEAEKVAEEDNVCNSAIIDGNQNPKKTLPVAAFSELDDMDTAESGLDSNCIDDSGVSLKRVSSFSEDEHPIKRRSTRFSERTNLTSAMQSAISGSNSGVLGARMSATRGTVRKDLVATKEPIDSEAFEHAYKQTCTWFEQSGIASEASLAEMLNRSQIASLLFAEQAPLHRKSSTRSLQSIKNTTLGWCLQVEAKQTRGRGADDLEKALRLMKDQTMKYTLDALLTQHSDNTQAIPEPGTALAHSMPTAAECVRMFKDNHGVFDTMLRYVKTALKVLCFAHFDHCDFKQIVLRMLVIIHAPLLDQITAGLLDQNVQTLSLVVVVIQLLSEFAVKDELWREQCMLLWKEWTIVAGGAIARLNDQYDRLKLHYRIAEAWTEYEMATATSSLGRATAAINLCYDLLQQHSTELDDLTAIRCSLSGMNISVEMVCQRRDHLIMFGKLEEATQLARSNEQRAISLLTGLISEEMCSISQRIAAARLLAVLCHRQSMKAKEVCAAMHELHLYLTLILECRQDSTQPVYLAIQHCSSLLKSVHSIATADKQIAQKLSAANKSEMQLAAQLAAMLLALAKHFLINPAPDSASGSPEVVFIGYSAWLVAKLTSILAVSNPIDKRAEYDCRNRHDSSCSDEPEMHIQFVDAIHDLLGERGLCTAADGAFLKLILELCRLESAKSTDASTYWDIAGATLRCLFDIKLHNCDTSFHSSANVEMDVAAANATYMLVEKELLETLRNRKGAGLRNDLKTIVDRTSYALDSIDIGQHPRIAMNMDVIDDYLDGTAMPTFGQIENALQSKSSPVLVACIPLVKSNTELPTACVTLPFVRATMQHDLLRFRMRAGMARAVEDYDEVLEDYKLYVSLHPTSAEAWLHLGQAHADLADELLLGTAAEIIECQHDIAVLQRAALACAVQAKQHLQPPFKLNDKSDSDQLSNNADENGLLHKLHVRVYSFIGRLVYCIATRPLPLLAFQVLPSNILVADDDNSLQQWDLGRWRDSSAFSLSKSLPQRYTQVPPKQRVVALARKMLSRALRLDPSNWKWVYFLGKSVAKLQEPISACVLYLKASHIAAASEPNFAKSGSALAVPEVAMEPMYKLLSTVSKLLYSRKIDAATSRRFVDALPCLPSDENDAQSIFTISGVDSDTEHVFITIRKALDRMCASDKRRWHHRPIFLTAWMDHWIFGDSERSKKTLLSLLQMRNTNKQLASFYKTDFEAPGKHYVYVEKYVHLYIETLKATDDIDGLRLLERKLKRSSDLLYDLPAVLLKITSAETDVLLGMVTQLNCPKFIIDSSGNEHIILHNDLLGANAVQVHSIFRYCRLNRMQFNYARDFAREHIASFTALQHHISSALVTPESEAVHSELSKLQTQMERHLTTANKVIGLFGSLLEHKKAIDDPAVLSRLNDGLADMYMLVLSIYGQFKCTALIPARNNSIDVLVNACREATMQLAHMPHLDRPEGSFWSRIIFDENRHEKSQQYKLLDPLLEFQINKLIDAAREAQLQPPAAALSEPAQVNNMPLHSVEDHTDLY